METRDSDNSYAASGSPIKASTKNAALQRNVSQDFGQIVSKPESENASAAKCFAIVHSDGLLNSAGDVGEHIGGVGADQMYRTHHDDKNDGQHHGIFRNVLSFFISPKFL